MNIKIPDEAQFIISTLEANGYEAYVVGGCVRDSLMDNEPKDWDICTPAIPEQTMKCFEGYHIVETGLQHGTITLVLNHKPFEITTYRIDGTYSDNRHPDKVEFVSDLKEDLSRRDFTINAMAYNPRNGIADFFGGVKDLNDGIIRCVGEADKRFHEDSLRIMRALRFASVLGFSIDKDTSKAMNDNRKLLGNIAVERIATELNKLILGDDVSGILLRHLPVISEVIPELIPTIGFEQNSPYHCYDVINHTLFSVDAAPRNNSIRLTMLFHDIAKPKCYTDVEGVGHFYGHPQASSDMAKEILQRLKYDNATIETVTQLILYHDADIQPRRKHIKRWLNKIGEVRLRQLIEVKKSDAMAQIAEHCVKKLALLNDVLEVLDEVIAQQQCFSLKDLAVNGRDLITAGFNQGEEIGKILNTLLNLVIEEKIDNDKELLLKYAKEGIRD